MPTVDNRVVQMQFDNRDFEENIDESISSLDKLKKALKFQNITEGFDEIVAATETMTHKFSALGTISDQIFRNIANELYSYKNKITALVKSMSLDQLNAGWDKYAEKTSAVKTIMSATSSQFKDEAEQMEYVNEQLDKLNWFTDETSYRLTDMTNNIGKFTNQGQDLDKSVKAMQGIATWAGLSGATVNEASRAMYNLSQAMGVGAVTLIDWKSISNANMATKEFKETALETAAALGTLKKQSDGSYKSLQGTVVTLQNFDHTLSDRWFSSDVLMATLEKFGGFSEELADVINKLWGPDFNAAVTTSEYLRYIEAYKNNTLDWDDALKKTHQSREELEADLIHLSSAEFDLGRRAFVAAQQAKTFGEAIDATKDAVSSKWLQTFEYIFGQYDKARVLWTRVSEELWNIFAKGIELRNEVLDEWSNNEGYDKLWKAIDNFWSGLKRLGSKSWEIWNAIFPSITAEQLLDFTDRLLEKSEQFKNKMKSLIVLSDDLSDEEKEARTWLTDLADIFGGVRSALDLLIHTAQKVKDVFVMPGLSKLGEGFKKLLSNLSPFAQTFSNFVTRIKESGNIEKNFKFIRDWFSYLGKTLREKENFSKLVDSFQRLKEQISSIRSKALEKLSNIFNKLTTGMVKLPDVDKVANVIDNLLSPVGAFLELLNGLFTVLSKVKNIITGLDFSSIGNLATSAATFVSTFIQSLASDDSLNAAGQKIFGSLWDGILKGIQNVNFKDLFSMLLKGIVNAPIIAIGVSLTKLFWGISTISSRASYAIKALGWAFESLESALKGFAFLQIALGIAALAAALLILSKVSTDKLTSVVVNLSVLLLVIALASKIANSVKMNLGSLAKFAILVFGLKGIIKSLGIALAGLGVAIFLIGKTDQWEKIMWSLFGFMTALIIILTALAKGLAKTKTFGIFNMNAFSSIIGSIKSLAISILILTPTLLALNKIASGGNLENVLLAFVAIVTVLLSGIFIITRLLRKQDRAGVRLFKRLASTFSTLTFSMLLLVPLLLVLSHIAKQGTLVSVVGSFVTLFMSLLVGLGAMAKAIAKNDIKASAFIKIGLSMLAIAIVMDLLIPVITAMALVAATGNLMMVTLAISLLSAVLLGSVFVMGTIASNNKASAGKMAGVILFMMALAVALNLLIPIISVLGMINDSSRLIGTVVSFVVILGALAGALFLISKIAQNTTASGGKIAALMLGLAVGLAAVSASLLILKGSSFGELMAIVGALSILMAALLAFGFVAGKFSVIAVGMKALTIALAALGVAVAAVGAGIFLLARGFEILSKVVLDLGNLKEVAKTLAESVGVFFSALMDNSTGIFTFVERLVSTIISIIAAKKANITQLGADMIKSLAGVLTGNQGVLIAAVAILIFGLLDYLGFQVDTIVDAIVVIIIKIVNGLAKAIINNSGPLWNAVLHLIGAAIYLVGDLLVRIEEGIADLFGDTAIGRLLQQRAGKMRSDLEAFGDNVKASIDNDAKILDASLKRDGDEIKDAANKLKEDSKDASEDIEDGRKLLEDSITGSDGGFSNSSGSFANGSFKTADDIFGTYQGIGKSAGDGYIEGLSDSIPEAISVSRKLGASSVDATKDELDEHSPSKVAWGIGAYFVEGFANSITSNSFLATDASEEMGSETVDILSDTISRIADAIDGNVDFNPTIRPVLDLSEIQNGSSRLNSIWSGYQFSPDMSFGLDRARSVTAATADINMNKTSLSEAMRLMQADIAAMKEDNAVIIGVMDRYMPYIPDIANMEVDLDGTTLVGKLAPKIDKELGRMTMRGTRKW